jgi:cell division protein FtsL
LRVRTKAKGLELGAAIAELTHEHNRLLDEKRRLEAERAYLRHPDHIQRVAIERLHMEPVQPERIQAIRLANHKSDRTLAEAAREPSR